MEQDATVRTKTEGAYKGAESRVHREQYGDVALSTAVVCVERDGCHRITYVHSSRRTRE